MLVHHSHILTLLRRDPAIRADTVLQLLARKRHPLELPRLGILLLLIKQEIPADTAAILQQKAPKIHL